ncbi:MAG: hypothetical protein V7704_00060 [Aurantimonas endophytica]
MGLRLALRHPERVAAIFSQNGNAYVDGFSDEWGRERPVGASRALPTGKPAGPRSRPTRSGTGNVALYPAFQSYFREHRPPLLAAWGRRDPAFLPAGAMAYRRDLPDAEIHLLDAGHFALETHAEEIAALIRSFLDRVFVPSKAKSRGTPCRPPRPDDSIRPASDRICIAGPLPHHR